MYKFSGFRVKLKVNSIDAWFYEMCSSFNIIVLYVVLCDMALPGKEKKEHWYRTVVSRQYSTNKSDKIRFDIRN